MTPFLLHSVFIYFALANACVFCGRHFQKVLSSNGQTIACVEETTCRALSQLATCVVEPKYNPPCHTGLCECPEGYKWSRNNSNCITAVKLGLGSPCSKADVEIYPKFASCNTSSATVACPLNYKTVEANCQLDCPENTTADHETQSCIPVGSITQCNQSSDCHLRMNSQCEAGICQCLPGFTEIIDLDFDHNGEEIVAKRVVKCVKKNYKAVDWRGRCDSFPGVWTNRDSQQPLVCRPTHTCHSCPEDRNNLLPFEILMNINRLGICRKHQDVRHQPASSLTSTGSSSNDSILSEALNYTVEMTSNKSTSQLNRTIANLYRLALNVSSTSASEKNPTTKNSTFQEVDLPEIPGVEVFQKANGGFVLTKDDPSISESGDNTASVTVQSSQSKKADFGSSGDLALVSIREKNTQNSSATKKEFFSYLLLASVSSVMKLTVL